MINNEEQCTENLTLTKVMSDGTIFIFQIIAVGVLSNKMEPTTCYRKTFSSLHPVFDSIPWTGMALKVTNIQGTVIAVNTR